MPAPESPHVIIRPSTAQAPTYPCMTPTPSSALRELRQHINSLSNENIRTPRPSEMTVLARRFGGIHIDRSPTSDCSTPKVDSNERPARNPIKLDFEKLDEDVSATSFKENVCTTDYTTNDNDILKIGSERKPPASQVGLKDVGNAESRSKRVSGTHSRLYTDKEVAEIRQAAIEAVIENLEASHREDVERFNQQRQEKERTLMKERAQNEELKCVLEEYEATINKMVAEANTHANTRERLLEVENSKLKAEVVEFRDAFEQLNSRYDKAKQTMDVMTTKEARLIENISKLKRDMIELQTWSNDLKLNTEKKLNKAFDSVTSFRTGYIEQEAHAKKALSDLAKAQNVLQKETGNHAVTAKKVAQLEIDLRNEQDARSELNGELTTMKANLTRIIAQRDSVASKLDDCQRELGVLRDKVNDLEPRATRASDFKKQMDVMRKERQGLKARAFDDITRIRELEANLTTKEGEVEELSAICEEVMSQLEACRLQSN